MLATHLFFMPPQRLAGSAQFNIYTTLTTVKAVATANVLIRGGDMSLWDTTTGLPVLVDQSNIGANQ